MDTLLPKIIGRRKKRLGQGFGSGKGGHTVGRGQKGQKARGKIAVLFEGIKVKKSLLKKLPFKRGRSKFAASAKPVIIQLSALNLLDGKAEIDQALLIKEGIVDAREAKAFGVKILGDGKKVAKKFVIKVPISRSAAKLIEAAGGRIES